MNRIVSSLNRLWCLSRIHNSIKFSTKAVRISENDPQNHKISHVGKFYKISDEDFSGCFDYQLKSEFCRLLRVFRDKSILVRKESVEIIDYLRNTDYLKPIARYVLYGRIGTGKTVCMAHVSHYAYSSGDWMIVHFGDLFQMLHFSPELTVNSLNEDMFDIPTMASAWLSSFMNLNAKFLTKYEPKLLRRVDWNQKEFLPEGATWREMINFAISRQKYASDCVGILLREARMHASAGSFRVLGVVRGVNCLYGDSKRCDLSGKYIHADRISVFAHLRRLLRGDWSNGAIVASVNLDTVYGLSAGASHYPRDLLGDEGFKDLDPFVPVEVGDYGEAEVSNYLAFLGDNRWLTAAAARDEDGGGREEIAFLAGGRPEELFKVTMEW